MNATAITARMAMTVRSLLIDAPELVVHGRPDATRPAADGARGEYRPRARARCTCSDPRPLQDDVMPDDRHVETVAGTSRRSVRCPGRAAIEERKGGDRYRGRVYRRPWRRDRSGRGSAVTGTLVTQATAAERPASALAPSQDRTNQNQPDASTDTTLGRVQGRDFPTAGCARNADMPSATEDGGRRRCHAGRPTDRAVPSTRARSCRRCKPQPAPPVADRTGGWAWSAAGGTGP